MKIFRDTFTLFISSVFLALLLILLGPQTATRHLEAKPAASVDIEISAGDDFFLIGEELQYNVSYSIFDIGIVKLQILDSARRGDVKVFKAKAYLDSYSGVPFVDLHQVFYSEMTVGAFSQFFSNHKTSKPEVMPFTKYSYDYGKGKAFFVYGTDPGNLMTKNGETEITEEQLDGLSLFYYSRKNFKQKKNYSVPVFVNEKSYKTNFNFMNKIGTQEIDAVKYPIEIVEFDGSSEFTGVFGLTGYFQGYFSNDHAGVPIVAKMKVIIGKVHIELIKWIRPGWVPPKAG